MGVGDVAQRRPAVAHHQPDRLPGNEGQEDHSPADAADQARPVLVAAGCYVVLVGFVGLFVLVAGSDPSHMLRGAASGGAVLAFGVVAPGFLVLSLVDAGIARLRAGMSSR
jgi:uncharacterized membrane protein